jgi:Domain of unknown function (DUF4388)
VLIGNLKDRQLPQVLYQLYITKATGTLILTLNQLRKALLFENGGIISAYSTSREDSLGEILMRSGRISVEEYLEIESIAKQGRGFAQLLLETGKVTEKELLRQMIYQVLGITYSICSWQTGSFEFADGKLPQKELPRLGLSTLNVIFQASKLTRSWEIIRKDIEFLDEELELIASNQERLSELYLTENEQALLQCVQPGRTIRDLIMLSQFNSFETCRLLMAFILIELVQRKGMPSWVILEGGENS